ncbi:FG-GAP-like repeat-containing protein [Psychromicrobium xiongbiense]|uniref:FG-GAP-like repeat-containing protein n=1 Tax=Psychromicrobium xiongbiense TaxID=3051184 RepID=UPI002556C1FE|nr:FG-GAP-like repeat-containing protein [Psychromicrobium sp. YIM S02556]
MTRLRLTALIIAMVAAMTLSGILPQSTAAHATSTHPPAASTMRSTVSATAPTDVGMWYSTWYSKTPAINPTWLTNFGGSSANQFVADVNGDGKADAVTFDSNGTWQVALSSGNGFSSPTVWTTNHGLGSTEQFLADVNGDGKADAVVYFNSDVNGDGFAGDWYIALSTGSSFQQWTLWKSGAGFNATRRLLADVNGDGKSDVAAFFGNDAGGTWAVATSTGSGFGNFTVWMTGFGGNTNNQFLADATGDGKADAIYYVASDGSWYITPSTGSGFGAASLWTTGHGAGSVRQFVTDGNGDSYAEPYVYFNADIGLPTPDGKSGDLVGREYDRSTGKIAADNILFNSGFGLNASNFMQANVTGDRYGWKASVAFYAGVGGGTWNVERYRGADTVSTNTWAGFPGKPAIRYLPLTLGSYQTYDSGDPAVIDEHIATITDAKVDWLLMDETNSLNNVSGAILNRAKDVAQRLKVNNDNPAKRQLRYAFAIGGVQWTGNPLTIEQEAAQTWSEFANNSTIGGANYYYQLDNKPLLVVYATKTIQNAWLSYTGDKSSTSHFTVRFASSDPAQPGEYGWQLDANGTPSNDEVMLTMPGWNNNVSGYTPVSRKNGLYYAADCWSKVLNRAVKPRVVVINSFNEFAEETGIQVADTSQLVAPAEKWYNTDGVIDNAMYWNMTKDFVNQLKSPSAVHRASAGFSSVQTANGWSYEEWNYSAGVRTILPMAWDVTNSRWQGTHTYALIGAGWQHPDVSADSARVYVAGASGAATISGVVGKQSSGGDGVTVRILKNDIQVWPASGGPKALTDTSQKTFLVTLSAATGDRLQFVVSSGATPSYDTVSWDPSITSG